MERKLKLIEALKKERKRFDLNLQNPYEHDIAIKYLETGEINDDPDKYELLYAVIYDFETTCSDYEC